MAYHMMVALSDYDAVQLACVLALREYTIRNQAPHPIFVCADAGLPEIAGVEGFHIENPNNYEYFRTN